MKKLFRNAAAFAAVTGAAVAGGAGRAAASNSHEFRAHIQGGAPVEVTEGNPAHVRLHPIKKGGEICINMYLGAKDQLDSGEGIQVVSDGQLWGGAWNFTDGAQSERSICSSEPGDVPTDRTVDIVAMSGSVDLVLVTTSQPQA